jgi:hypothetical protein
VHMHDAERGACVSYDYGDVPVRLPPLPAVASSPVFPSSNLPCYDRGGFA